jgi:carboxyl-terminal processing protease
LALWALSTTPAWGVIWIDPPAFSTQTLVREAQQAERDGDWSRAADRYRLLLARERGRADFRAHYQTSSRRSQQIRRHRDTSFRQQVTALSQAEALQLYADVLNKIQTYFVDADKTEPAVLFRQGLEEYKNALEDSQYVSELLATPGTESLRSMRAEVFEQWENRSVTRVAELPELIRTIAEESPAVAGLPPAAVVFEFLCGACAGLDDYSSYLTPAQLKEITSSWKGKIVSAGLEVAVDGRQLVIAQILPGSSAQDEGIHLRDRVLRIAEVATAGLTSENAEELLRGDVGTRVTIVVAPPGSGPSRQVTLKRQLVRLPSISEPRFADERLGIGYVRMNAFQETTVRELDEAIAQMQMAGMKALIVDFRGNEGGLFDVAVQIAERFISAGLIVSTHGPAALREFNRYYYSRGLNFLTIPIVVLVDGETASAAELVAGALKEHQRGMLVGETTFGKGCMQKVLNLSNSSAGVRLTVAKFYSPRGHAYTPNGIAPDLRAPRSETMADFDQDPQLQTALEVVRPLASAR